MKKVNYLSALAVAGSLLAINVGSAFAQPAAGIDYGTSQVTVGIGKITTIGQVVTFVLNLFVYLGWVGVIIGVGLAIFGLVYKLINTDSEEAMKTVQGYLTKAVLIVVAGILLISAGFIVRTVTGFIPGFTGAPKLDSNGADEFAPAN